MLSTEHFLYHENISDLSFVSSMKEINEEQIREKYQ